MSDKVDAWKLIVSGGWLMGNIVKWEYSGCCIFMQRRRSANSNRDIIASRGIMTANNG